METCLLIPEQLAIAVTRDLDPQSMVKVASIWSKTTIPVGHTFYSDEGQIHHGNIDIYSVMDKTDIRQVFGGYDLVLDVQGHKMRHCNWIRFARSSTDINQINLVATRDGSRAAYRTVKEITMGEEMIVFFNSRHRINKAAESENMCTDKTDKDEDCEIDVCGISEDEEDLTEKSTESKQSPLTSLHTTWDPSFECLSTNSICLQPHKRMRLTHEEEEFDSGIGETAYPLEVVGVISSPEQYEAFKRDHSTNNGDKRQSTPIHSNINPLKRKRGKTFLKCEFCDKEFDRPSLLKRHERTHTGEKPHVCDVCGKAFSTTSSMNTHRRIHFGEKPHECDVCGKRFTASSNLYYHKMTHTKDKPHKCTLCTKSFPTPGDLRSHLHIHSGTYPFTCSLCHKGFSKQASLKHHMISHTESNKHVMGNLSQQQATPLKYGSHQESVSNSYASLNAVSSLPIPYKKLQF